MGGSRRRRYWVIFPFTDGTQTTVRHSKHYLEISGKSVLEWSLGPFLKAEWIDGIVLLLPRHEAQLLKLPIAGHPKIVTAYGCGTRSGSMLAALKIVESLTADLGVVVEVFIHDPLRPCVTLGDIERLANEADEEHGGVLATPLTDDLRRATRDRAGECIAAQDVWRIQSPLLFRLDHLTEALEQGNSRNAPFADEVTAMQSAGHRPRLVKGRQSNMKVTHSEDLVVAEFWLSRAEYLR